MRLVSPLRAGSGEALGHVRRMGSPTVSDLVEAMGLARSTVGERIERLARHGFVRRVEAPVTGRGRPATTYCFDPRAGLILSAQVGMTGVRLGVSDLEGTLVVHRLVEGSIDRGVAAVIGAVEQGFSRLLRSLGEQRPSVHGIGVGLPGAVELRSLDASGGVWDDYPIASRLTSRFDAPTFVDQDVNLLALGEHSTRPTAPGALMCVKVGSVIGCGVVVDGRIIAGADGVAGEIGHTRVPGRNELCGCGNRGCLNAAAGGTALAARLTAAGYRAGHPRDVVQLANDGVVPAIAAVRQAGRDLGTVLAGAVNLLNPRIIAFWGYLVGAEEVLFAGIRETLYQEANPAATHRLDLVSTELADLTGLRGASVMVAEQILAPEAIDQRLAGDRTC